MPAGHCNVLKCSWTDLKSLKQSTVTFNKCLWMFAYKESNASRQPVTSEGGAEEHGQVLTRADREERRQADAE